MASSSRRYPPAARHAVAKDCAETGVSASKAPNGRSAVAGHPRDVRRIVIEGDLLRGRQAWVEVHETVATIVRHQVAERSNPLGPLGMSRAGVVRLVAPVEHDPGSHRRRL
jgi:hypothetical protein